MYAIPCCGTSCRTMFPENLYNLYKDKGTHCIFCSYACFLNTECKAWKKSKVKPPIVPKEVQIMFELAK